MHIGKFQESKPLVYTFITCSNLPTIMWMVSVTDLSMLAASSGHLLPDEHIQPSLQSSHGLVARRGELTLKCVQDHAIRSGVARVWQSVALATPTFL